MEPYLEIINRHLSAPLTSLDAYEPCGPNDEPKFIYKMCLELLDESYRVSPAMTLSYVLKANIYASGHSDYSTTFAFCLAKMVEILRDCDLYESDTKHGAKSDV
jgi:hypothetical protein